jgi:RNA polymerase subunit RPABC4/transcription elongation factor Spt4
MMHDPKLKERAKELRKQGLLAREIAVEIDVPKATVIRWLNPSFEKQERARARKRKFSQRRRCPKCRRRMADKASLCVRCFREKMTEERRWNRETIIDAMQMWAQKHGHAPTYAEWQRGGSDHPATSSMLRGPYPSFASWSEALLASGFVPRQHRAAMKMTPQERAALRREVREQKIIRAVGKENNGHAAGVRDDEGVLDTAGSETGGS